jgi:hypothetical protein
MEQGVRWAVAFAVALFIVALIAFARGEPRHGEPTPPPAVIVTAA